MKTRVSAISLALALGFAAIPVSANILDGLSINVGAISVMPDDSSSNLNVVEAVAGLPAGSTAVGVNTNTQLGLTFDYKITQNWTVELIAATPFNHDISVKGSAIDGLKIGKTKHLPPTLLAQYHFTTNSRFDPFIGIGINYTNFFQEEVSGELNTTLQALNVTTADDRVELKLKDSWGLAFQAGVNYKVTDNLGIHFMVSKMDIDTTGRVLVNKATIQTVDVDIDPYVAMIGLRWEL
ncbi:OmpW family outer membrane protein [Chromatiaceae bacterium AAb-1]|nr:OmpW family outer membrane protein [Chromatiaceae bacterium AAb-1]